MPTPQPDPSSPDAHRLARIEEAVTFNDRAVEEFNQQLRYLFAQLQQVTHRMEALERRLGSMQDRLENPDPGPEKPPHSA